MKILVTGGAGFIGSYLVEKLIDLSHDVGIYDNYLNFTNNPKYYQYALVARNKMFKNKPHKIYKADIRERNKLKRAIADFRPEVVVHLAGLPMARVPKNHAKLMVPINLIGTINVLDAFEQSSDTKKIIFASSSMSSGHFLEDLQKENSLLNPRNAYGSTKAAAEYFVKLSKKEWVIVRPICVYGFTDCSNRVTQLLLDAAITKQKAWIVDGEKLDLTYIDDVVEGLIRCILDQKAVGQTINISAGKAVTVKYFAELVKAYFPNFKYENKQPMSSQVNRGGLDISRAKRLLGYHPNYNIKKGLEKTLSLMSKFKWDESMYKRIYSPRIMV